VKRRVNLRQDLGGVPAAEAVAHVTPESVTESPRQLRQARQIARLRSGESVSSPVQRMLDNSAPVQLNDDRNWWQRHAPYVLGGKAPHENRSYRARWLPMALGGKPAPQAPVPSGTAPQDTRGFMARWLPTALGGKPTPKAPQVRQAEPDLNEESKEEKDPLPPEDRARVLVDPEPSDGEVSDGEVSDSEISAAKKKKRNQKKNKQKREARARREVERQEEERRQQDEELRRQLAATKSIPRRVVRHDRDFTSPFNNRGQGKAHRMGSDLMPAGNTPVTAVEQLHQGSPNKGTSNRISFASRRATQANDYSARGTRPSVEFKARKHARARIKGKPDALGFSFLSAQDVIDEVEADTSPYATTEVQGADDVTRARKASARNFARRDGESQTVGRVPARFVRYSTQVGPDPFDSDSDGDVTA
jgi:hypothetical protein